MTGLIIKVPGYQYVKHERERRGVGPYLTAQRLCYPVRTIKIAAPNSSLQQFSGTDERGCWTVGAEA